jgi:hypothetical protein
MKAIVVYESLWGNTAAVARAIAEGIGEGTQAISTSEASPASIADVDLIVAGSPVIGFSLPDDGRIANIRNSAYKNPQPDLSQPSMRTWLKTVPQGHGRSAAFETRIWWSLGGATAGIMRGLEAAGYPALAKGARFIVKGTYGPLRDGELERARQWGADLAKAMA